MNARVVAVQLALSQYADAQRAMSMAAYMKGHFAFYGVPAPQRKACQREALLDWRPDAASLVAFARAAWRVAEREMQYVACDALDRHRKVLSPSSVNVLEELVVTRSWWDTVDAIAPVVGGLAKSDSDVSGLMSQWVDHDHMWLRRVAILHQLRWKHDTDADLLFEFCARRAHESEFFIRKAIGWALREYSKTNPDAVRGFVVDHAAVLSGLSQREALKHIQRQG